MTRLPVPVQSRAVVAHSQMQSIFLPLDRRHNHAVFFPLRNSMPDGILHNRLQQEARHQSIQRPGIHSNLHAQPVREPHLLDGQIVFDNVQFRRQRNFFRAHSRKRRFQNAIQMAQRLGSLFIPSQIHQVGDRI